MTPLIFLDFDHTLNTVCDAPLSPVLVNNLKHICLKTNADIVVTSNQRLIKELYQLAEDLYEAGLPRHINVIHKTDSLRKSDGDRSRWAEIKKWLDDNKFDGRWVIIDDACGGNVPEGRYVKVNHRRGLSLTDAEKAINILNE